MVPISIFSFFKKTINLFKKFFGNTISLSRNSKNFPELIFAPNFLAYEGF